jgi:hypothetical protein
MKKSKPKDDVDSHSISDDSISSSSSNLHDEKKFRKASKSFVFGSKQQVPAEVSVNVTPERTMSQYDDSTVGFLDFAAVTEWFLYIFKGWYLLASFLGFQQKISI